MRTRRGKTDIWMRILEICRTPIAKTTIVYQANLNFRTVVPHLEFLLERGWLECVGTLYKTTKEGEKAIEVYNLTENEEGIRN